MNSYLILRKKNRKCRKKNKQKKQIEPGDFIQEVETEQPASHVLIQPI